MIGSDGVDPAEGSGGVVRLIDLPRIHDPRGDLTAVQGGIDVPFDIARVYFVYNVPTDAERGGHAHKKCEQVLFALSGSFRVVVDDGNQRADHVLRNPQKGLFLSKMVWREMDSFSQGAVLMVLASTRFSEADYIRDYNEFRSVAKSCRL